MGLESLSTLSLIDKGPTLHTWSGSLLWMISENLEKVRALLEKFLFPGSLFSCNSESYVRKLDKIRPSDKNST